MKDPGTNTTGFSALPAGFYNGTTNRFDYLMGNTYFWTVNAESAFSAFYFELGYDCENLMGKTGNKDNGYSIRGIKR